MAKLIADEQEFTCAQLDEDLNQVIRFEKVFLLSQVLTVERYLWAYLGDDDEPRTCVGTQQERFILLAPYERVRDLWVRYRQQQSKGITLSVLAN